MVTCFKIIQYLRYLPLIGPNMISLIGTILSVRVLTFGIFVCLFLAAVALGAYIRFGSIVCLRGMAYFVNVDESLRFYLLFPL